MKKILLFIISFFFFVPNTFAAANISSISIDVNLDINGDALIKEEWNLETQENTYYIKEFYDAKDIIITDYSVTNNALTYEQVNKLNKDKTNTFTYKDSGSKKKLEFITDGSKNTIIIQYKVSGIITKFSDMQGINYYFYSNTNNQKVKSIDIYIHGPIEFNENNAALYGIGKNISCTFSEGKIHIFSSNITSKSKIRLLTSFNNIDFTNGIKKDMKIIDYYNEVANKSPLLEEMMEIIKNEAITIIIIIIALVIISSIIIKVINNIVNKNNYPDIHTYRKDHLLGTLNSADYYDSIPCDGDLYKIAFYANYYKIVKNRSNLIGAILLKWILEEKANIIKKNDKYSIKLDKNMNFTNRLDQELYLMLKEASNNNIIDTGKISIYISANYDKIINWYNETVKYVIKDEYNKKNVIVKKKFGRTRIILNNCIYEDAKKIQGLKKYLLNFNQVPRRTELNEEVYKYSILISILLGVDESFSREILRKNPDNKMAKDLLEYEKVKSLYKNVFGRSLEEYKKHKHKKIKNLYDPTKGDS